MTPPATPQPPRPDSPGPGPVGPGDRPELARRGFAGGTDAYDRARPTYRDEAVDHLCAELGIGPGARVLDLAAGTGKMTRILAARGADVEAVEPSGAMRDTFARVLPGVTVRPGSAEDIPAADGRYDAVVVAQAFHWFDAPAALREIARVLRPGGGLGLVWNERDESEPWAAGLSEVAEWTGRQPYVVGTDFRADVDASGLFEPCARRTFRWRDELTHDQLVARVGTFSYVVAMEEPERARLLARVRAYVETAPEPVGLPYLTDTFTARRRDRG
jgi:SAM-dependent methyltransferase